MGKMGRFCEVGVVYPMVKRLVLVRSDYLVRLETNEMYRARRWVGRVLILMNHGTHLGSSGANDHDSHRDTTSPLDTILCAIS